MKFFKVYNTLVNNYEYINIERVRYINIQQKDFEKRIYFHYGTDDYMYYPFKITNANEMELYNEIINNLTNIIGDL